MMDYDYDAVVYDSDIYCIGCLPDGVDVDDVDSDGYDICAPIFAGSEWDYAPVCCVCGAGHDYMTIIKYPPHIEEGSTSSDSCKLEDIVNGVSDLIPKDLLDAFDAAPGWDEQSFAFDEIFDHLNEIAPDGLMFGASECDGACYGFWKIEEDI